MNKIKSIMVWCVSIYSILAGICTNEFTISNILFILAGLCIMPPVVKKITEKTSKYSKRVKWIIFIALTLFAYGTYPTSNIEVNNNMVQEQSITGNYIADNEVTEVNPSAEEQAKREAEEQAEKEAEEEAKRQAEEQAKKEAEEEAKRLAEEQAKKEAEEEAKRLAKEQAKKEAEEQVKREAEEQARKEAEAQAKREAEEQARKEAEAQAKKQAESQTKKQSTKVTVPASETGSNLVWVPTNGGTKYHRRSGCSNMKNPNQVTKETAEANGFTPCGRCY